MSFSTFPSSWDELRNGSGALLCEDFLFPDLLTLWLRDQEIGWLPFKFTYFGL